MKSNTEDITTETQRRSRWLEGIVALGLGLSLLGLGAGAAHAGPRTKGTAAPDACDIQGARFGEPGTVVTDLLDQGGFVACLHKATNREALDCVAETAILLQGSDHIDPTGAPIWLAPKPDHQGWVCSPFQPICSCEGNDDCVSLILFGPCPGGTLACTDDNQTCTCTY